ncbi:ABC transporter C family member 3 [Citrus sinensis]|uniref:ABC transporter C family member 3 n=1 Tax=Citrus clementina TaxID=85681 RepID=UPI0003D6EC30|nr:ABC transporter C family member 3 [Citrus x clementina]XP_052290248.1 ABC transporter C family member 3-like isoform X3 [Citrus sinensis]KAH9652209.1 ABC transporter C family member 3 [Citrus sinensis]
MYSGTDFLLKQAFLRGVSGSLHLFLLLGLFGLWVWKKLKVGEGDHSGGSKERFKNKKALWYKLTLVCCFVVSLSSLVLCLLSYFYWYGNGRSYDQLVILFDFGVRTLGWGAICVYLRTVFLNLRQPKLPILLKIWWGFYVFISCYCLIVDIVLYQKQVNLPIQFLLSDVVSVITGLLPCFVGFMSKNEGEDTLILQEPLLKVDSGESEGTVASIKSRGADTVTPYSNAGLFSVLTYTWINSLIALGNKKTLDLEDVPQLDSGNSVVGVFATFKNKLETEAGLGSGLTSLKLIKAMFRSVWKDFLLTALVAVVCTLATYVGPYLIDTLVQYLSGKRDFENEGYALVSAFCVAKLVECLCQRFFVFRLEQLGIRLRAALIAMIYNKSLKLSSQAKQGNTSGEIINFMTVDAERVAELSWYIHDPWLFLLEVALSFLILYKSLGIASVAAFFGTVIFMLVNVPLSRVQEKFQNELMKSKDERMKATSEILRNMRILKLQGWELKFLSKTIDLRKSESGWLKRCLYTSSITSFVFWCAPTFVSVITFGTCILLKVPLESGKVLSAIATFRLLQILIYKLPAIISMTIQTKVSLQRIASFFCLDELQPDLVEKQPRGSSETAIEIADGNFSWDISSHNPTLKDINLKVFHGMRVAVCGTVGSGKSSLLSCILGEVPKISGTLKLCGTKAYVAQSPWIQSGKIEDNILFGKEMDRERYNAVLDACSLEKDLEILSFGDQTVVGERGINLSGGQKQRIQIARALYQDADIYLFDDPFSAVDAHTGSHLFKEVLLGLLNSKTVLYVTHQVEFLPAADLVLVIKDGKITQAGKYTDVINSGTDFMELVDAHKQALSTLDSIEGRPLSEKGSANGENDGTSATDGVVKEVENKEVQNDREDKVAEPQRQLVQEEEREKGKVEFSVYWKYITAAYGGVLVPFILLAQTLFQILQIASNYWIAWATPASKDIKPRVTGSMLLIVFVALAFGSSFCILARSTLLATAGYKTATLLFNKMHYCIFRAPMSFFDATPSGRIINRASTDQSAVDLSIPALIGSFAFSIIRVLGVIGVMSLVAWQVFIVFIPVIATCIWYQQYYISSARELSRLVGVCKAPLIQHFAETVSGSTTIRSFDQESRFIDTNMELMDGYSRPTFHVAAAMEWLGLRLDMLSNITFAFSLVFLISIPKGFIDPAIAGLAVTYGLTLNNLQAMLIWLACQMENKIISVERIFQYTCIPSEPPLEIEESRPNHSWPSHGKIDLRDLQVRYAPHMPFVLRGISCTFPGGKKTGIVGRTGSGKSTLIQTLFRIVEPAAGQILIDGIDISLIGLHDLRTRLSIIPQDPVMFEGTVRSNVDPLEEYTDEQIWEALDKCQLGDEVRKKEGKLDSKVTENGENWSMGQRQLVCLGRVLLKRRKILMLDEATASVDTATDNLIQQSLRQHFSDCTVITIAHRITSVIDSDMVLLLSHGLIEEYDSPRKLLENKSSSFSQLVAEYTQRSSSSLAGN